VVDPLTEADYFSGKLNGFFFLYIFLFFQTCSASALLCYYMSLFWCARSRLTSARRVISALVPAKPRTAARLAGHWPGIPADAATSVPGWSGNPAADRTGRTATAPWG